MKLLHIIYPLIIALPFAITASPIAKSNIPRNQQRQGQQPLAPPNPLSPANSFSTSSDVESASSESSKSSRISLSKFLKPAKTFSSFGSSGEFKCHSYPQSSLLAELAVHVTNLLKSSRDEIFQNTNRASSESIFETCYAGYTADDVSPAIYFGRLAKKQAKAIESILRNRVVGTWPGVKVVTSKDAIALVKSDDGTTGIKRRNTV